MATASFVAGQILKAVDLNTSLNYGDKLGGNLDNTPLGQSTAAAAKFTHVELTTAPAAGDNSNSVPTTAWVRQNSGVPSAIDNTPIGSVTPSTGRFTTLALTASPASTDNSNTVATTAWVRQNAGVPSAIDNTPIGSVTPSTGRFTTLAVTTAPVSTDNSNTVATTAWVRSTLSTTTQTATLPTALNGTTIGLTTPAAGKFTTLTLTSTPAASDSSNLVPSTAWVNAAITAHVPSTQSSTPLNVLPLRKITNGSPVQVAATDYIVQIENTTPVAMTVTLEANPVAGTIHIIKDALGVSAMYPITILTSGAPIDGSTALVMNANYAAVSLYCDGANWSVF